MNLKIVFFGTPPFAAHILEYLATKQVEIVGIVTRPDRPQGRALKLLPSAIKAFAKDHLPQVPLFDPERASTDQMIQKLKELDADVFVVVAYGEILKQNILSIPRLMPINVHPSLLPKYRGAAPIQRTLFNGDRQTGVSIMKMVLKMDAGDVLEVVPVVIDDQMDFGQLEEKLCSAAGPALVRVLEKMEKGTLIPVLQDESKVTYAKKIKPEDRLILWDQTNFSIHNQIRALSPRPGAFCYVLDRGRKKRLVIKKAQRVDSADSNAVPGQNISFGDGKWIIACSQGAISLDEVQLEGKKSLKIKDFLAGHPTALEPISDTPA